MSRRSPHLLSRGRHINPRHLPMSIRWTFNIVHVYSLHKPSMNTTDSSPCNNSVFPHWCVCVCVCVSKYVCVNHVMVKSMCFGVRETWLGKSFNVSKPQFSHLHPVDKLRTFHIRLSWQLNEIAQQQPAGKRSVNGTIIFALSVLLLINTMRFGAPLGQGLFIFLLL